MARTVWFYLDAAPQFTDGIWASNSVNTLDYDEISGVAFLEFGTEKNGFEIQQSLDGENWDVSTPFTLDPNGGLGFSVPLVGKFVRIKITLDKKLNCDDGIPPQQMPWPFRLGVAFK